ncbi:MAG: 2-oxoacid:acceptor oxidoreductase subunit alpha [Chloroflexi bacterium]|nr:MAG: 2-oxoacid:acceptor oxidoreductase subunit alpha [Chloroflexota bacterium]TMC30751.1 MAG: 2-oxoacid:acceptor oxidoreductase subunit alpha [Chloroflexota bacterium]TME39585.1 MAG: 2-oxoacid:acceptor oxidoreductase subunit alpha [Chloroflexota bacterium]
MQKNQLTWMIGGPQGSGINASAEVFAKACSRAGLRVYANIEYHSNIMGKHSFYRVRVGDEDVRSYRDNTDILVALDHETLAGDGDHRRWATHFGHLHQLNEGGGVIYDSEIDFDPSQSGRPELRFYPVPFMEIIKKALEEVGKGEQARRYEVMKNTVGLGASLALCDYPFDLVGEVIRGQFKGKRSEVGELNVRAARLAFDHVRDNFDADGFPYTLKPGPEPKARILAKGYEIAAIAKLKAGCALQTYYPISPATDESVFLEKHQREYGLLVVQCEDEISSINMAVGASHMGVRASTATSGPGFALMVEGIGFASITEAPGPVLVLYQRGGPSTGLPTRQEQGDLLFALHPAQGDFPHIVTAPGDLRETYQDIFSAFNWAERYQLPVIVLSDKKLAAIYTTIDKLELKYDQIDRGALFTGSEWTSVDAKGPNDGHAANGNGHGNGELKEYLRYALTKDGISPRSRPGIQGGRFWSTTDEHDPDGHITEGVEMRVAMMRKRMGKLALVAKAIPQDQQFTLHGAADAELTIVAWGSTKGTVLDSIKVLEAEGKKINFLQCRLMRPFPAQAVGDILRNAKRVVCIEENYSGQLATHIAAETGFLIKDRINKFDGRPFSEDEMIAAIRGALAGKTEAVVTNVR